MGAFWSSVDNADEQETRVFGVIGELNKPVPAMKFRISVAGVHKDIDVFQVFESPYEAAFPPEWLDKCKAPIYSFPARFNNTVTTPDSTLTGKSSHIKDLIDGYENIDNITSSGTYRRNHGKDRRNQIGFVPPGKSRSVIEDTKELNSKLIDVRQLDTIDRECLVQDILTVDPNDLIIGIFVTDCLSKITEEYNALKTTPAKVHDLSDINKLRYNASYKLLSSIDVFVMTPSERMDIAIDLLSFCLDEVVQVILNEAALIEIVSGVNNLKYKNTLV